MQKSLLSLINEAKPRRVLFTTYTFSISWFEAFILPALRNCGCEQIDVLVDASEACNSTKEATCLHAGSGYRVISVSMEGSAVFHPKLVYLEGFEHDNLVVSSANLTLAGHGKNLEVVDAVSSYREPAVFGEFAEFIDALVGKYEFAPENKAILRTYERRARTLRAAAGDIDEYARTTWLIHTLNRSAAEQFAVLADRLTRPETLTVLSPYHSPSGEPVQNLAAAVHAFNMQVGISRVTAVAPFEESQTCFVEPVEYVVVETEDAFRFPHAKCFELQAEDGVLVMTGSVNATSQSLESTTNVEVALVRRLSESPFTWTTIEPKDYVACDFRSMSLTVRQPAVQATWRASQRIVGTVTPTPGAMQVKLAIWEGDKCLTTMPNVELTEDGAFDVLVTDDFEYTRALRVVLSGEDTTATGWLNVELQLTATDAERKLLRAANRMRAGEFNIADMGAIFSWMQTLGTKQRERSSPEGQSSGSEQRDETGVPRQSMSYEEWRRGFEDLTPLGASASVTRVSLEAALLWINSDLTGELPTANAPSRVTGTDSKPKEAAAAGTPRLKLLMSDRAEYDDDYDVEDDADSDRARVEEAGNALFQKFVASLPRALELDAHSAIVPMIVELAVCAVLKRALVHKEPRKADSNVPSELLVIDGWLERYSKFDYSAQNREKLLPFFCAMACCAAHYHQDSSRPAVKEALQRMARRAVPADEIYELARMALHSRWFERVPTADHDEVATSGKDIAECVTLTQQLENLIDIAVNNPAEKTVIPREFEAVMKAVKQHRTSRDKVFGNLHATSTGCPCCHVTIKPRELNEILSRRAALCTNCQRALFAGLDKAELAKKGLAGRYKG
ncbi:hypothetical protein [Paraburkholderia hospita]|uniref:PLD-like domain-containing protein n=1 Tax=Paraburkholderia hospita TaxID=169430 RepID=A0AAN1MH98_9BURK|nr:hypothetical protein [Paraburkholderia hospita]AUT67043.1 hypothetical protein C2L64_00810 [Paraburkholderia hospita]SEH41127.1 hypothetical protein SAMN05192544_1001304 [Paraburkholderia hospita]